MTAGSTPSPVSHRVIEAVATHVGVEPTELEPLYYTLDTEALDALISGDNGAPELHVQFTFAGCQVTVTGDEEIEVNEMASDRIEPRVSEDRVVHQGECTD